MTVFQAFRHAIVGPIVPIALGLTAAPGLAEKNADLAKADWNSAIGAFYKANRNAPNVYDVSDASACRGRWALHIQKIEVGTFPALAEDLWPAPLRLAGAISEIAFFELEHKDPLAFRSAYEEAERALALAFDGDVSAAGSYFARLGECYSAPEEVRDTSEIGRASDAPANPTIADSEFDEPENLRRLAFIENFAESLEAGARVSGYFGADFDFSFIGRHDCGAKVAQILEGLPASDVDIGFMFWVSIQDEGKECAGLPEPEEMESFNLGETVSRWSQIDVLVDDHNFEAFVVRPREASDFLIVHIEPHATGFAVSKLEYDGSGL